MNLSCFTTFMKNPRSKKCKGITITWLSKKTCCGNSVLWFHVSYFRSFFAVLCGDELFFLDLLQYFRSSWQLLLDPCTTMSVRRSQLATLTAFAVSLLTYLYGLPWYSLSPFVLKQKITFQHRFLVAHSS